MTGSTLRDVVCEERVPILGPVPVFVHVSGVYVPRQPHLCVPWDRLLPLSNRMAHTCNGARCCSLV